MFTAVLWNPSASLLAFGLATPFLLWGAALGAIPVLIHLLHRRRYRDTPWAAMQFLKAAARRQSRRMQIEQWLLLLLRVAALALLSLALARPTLGALSRFIPARMPVLRVIVIDRTLSQQAVSNQQTRFEQARQQAQRVLSFMRPGDGALLAQIGNDQPPLLMREPSYLMAAVQSELERIEPGTGPGSPLVTLAALRDPLRLATGFGRREVIVCSDFQQSTWWTAEPQPQQQLAQVLADLKAQAQVTFLAVDVASLENTAVVSLSTTETLPLANRPLSVSATVRHFGLQPRENVTVELLVNGRLSDARQVRLNPNEELTVNFTLKPGAGDQRIEVRLPDDALAADNIRRITVPIREEVRVLLVNGKPAGNRIDEATGLLELALSPRTGRGTTTSSIIPSTIAESELISTDLTRYEVVFLCNVGQLTEREAGLLERYTAAGGCTVFTLGDQVQPDRYNQLLASGKTPLLPARLIERRGSLTTAAEPLTTEPEASSDRWFTFDPEDHQHPIMRPFAGNPGTGLELARTLLYYRVAPIEGTGGRVALRFSGGDPAIVEHPYGRGRSILITTAVDRLWSTWAVWGHSFVPIVQELVQFGMATTGTRQSSLTGESLVGRPIGSTAFPAVKLQRPDGNSDNVSLDPATGCVLIDGSATTQPGFYELRYGPPVGRSEWFAVNVDPQESPLEVITKEQLSRDLFGGAQFSIDSQWQPTPSSAGGPVLESTPGELSRLLLWLVLACLLLETALGAALRYGIATLGGLLLLAALDTTWRASPWAAAGLLVLLVIAGGYGARQMALRSQRVAKNAF